MKIKEGFIKRQVGERVVVVPIGEAAKNFHGMINLNETGGELWDLLKENTEIELAEYQDTLTSYLINASAEGHGTVEGSKAAIRRPCWHTGRSPCYGSS